MHFYEIKAKTVNNCLQLSEEFKFSDVDVYLNWTSGHGANSGKKKNGKQKNH